MAKKYIVDTNALIDHLHDLDGYSLVLLNHVLRELEKHKSSKNNELAYKAREVSRFIRKNEDKFIFDGKDYDGSDYGDNKYEDNNILKACTTVRGNEVYGLITGDSLLRYRAKSLDIEVMDVSELKGKSETIYTGMHKLMLTNSIDDQNKLADIYEIGLLPSGIDLLTNEYLIVYVNNEPIDKFRFDGKSLVKLNLPHKKTINPKNEEQECALDLLNNKDIPIKFIIGTYGSGKTFLNVKMAIHKVIEKGEQSKIMVIRNPLGAGESIGYLKGTKEDKTNDFFKPFVQHLQGGEQEAVYLESSGRLLREIPYYIKGLDIQDTFVVCDEAEDLDKKLIKLIGTRISNNSVVCFCGDYNQAEDKFINNNGLKIAVDRLKGHPLVGVVALTEDIRSEASKVFAEMD